MIKKEKGCNYKDPYKYTGFLVWVIGNMLTKSVEESHVNSKKMLFSNFMVLASLSWLLADKKKVNQRTLASYTHLREITISTIVKKLNTQNYITVVVDDEDKRSKSLLLTNKGESFLVEMLDEITKKEELLQTKKLSGLQEKLTSLLHMLSGGHQ
jgi:DNA-binding MarR family transcriptional regulator